MAKIQDVDLPHLEFAEGSAPSTPAAAIVRIYGKSDGLMYSKDDAGTETLMSSGAGGGFSSGTAFPGGPSTNDLFYRTNIRGGMLFRYDGTRWVSDQMLHWNTGAYDGNSADSLRTIFSLPTDYQIWVEAWETSMFITGTGVWIATLDLYDFEADITNVATKSSTGQTASRFYHYRDAIGTAVDGTGGNAANAKSILAFWFDESSGTATVIGGATVFYRLIAT